ncbi:hypothetical protein B0H11DRAFT_438682 [Mycena galericulata]|nr:hypothetical protein B0H11DRAFT_438682 [Mycena galericulata]
MTDELLPRQFRCCTCTKTRGVCSASSIFNRDHYSLPKNPVFLLFHFPSSRKLFRAEVNALAPRPRAVAGPATHFRRVILEPVAADTRCRLRCFVCHACVVVTHTLPYQPISRRFLGTPGAVTALFTSDVPLWKRMRRVEVLADEDIPSTSTCPRNATEYHYSSLPLCLFIPSVDRTSAFPPGDIELIRRENLSPTSEVIPNFKSSSTKLNSP